MAKNPTPTTIKTNARVKAVSMLKDLFPDHIQVGDSEIAIPIDTAPTGETIYATISPTVKDYCERKTPNKIIPAFNPIAEKEKWENHNAQKAEKAEQTKKAKAEKIERDRKVRERRKGQ